jgi:DNA-binding beta-propeller fold protein YncE
MASQPYAIAAGDRWAFVGEPAGFVAVLRLRAATAQLVRTVPVPGEPLGAALTGGDRVLLVANYLGGLEVLSTVALESGSGSVVVAQVRSRGRGDDEVVVDGSYAFVPEELSGDVAVYDLGHLLGAAGPPRAPNEVGTIPVGPSPSGIALDLPARRLYVISQAGATEKGYGELTAVDVAEAESHPGRAVLGAVAAGCDPARVALSGGGTVAWVTDRGADTLLALRLTQRSTTAVGHVIAAVRVGSNPVDVTLVDSGSVVLVTDSARYSTPDEASTVAAVNAADALAGLPSLLGYLPAGAFPRQFGRDGDGPLFFTDYNSMDLRVMSPADLRWLGAQKP